jgi:hypothetical protein
MSSRNPNGESQKPSFWNTLPGLITAIAALITAVGGVATLYYTQRAQSKPDVVVAPSKGASPPVNPQSGFPPDQSHDAGPAKPTTENPLREGKYELQKRNGAPQKSGVIMQLSKVTDDHFLVQTTRHTHYLWGGELIRKDDEWNLVLEKQGSPKGPTAITIKPGDPGSGLNQVMRQGPLVTFKGRNGTFVWRMVKSTGNQN